MKRSTTSGMILAALLLVVPVAVGHGKAGCSGPARPRRQEAENPTDSRPPCSFPRQPAGQPLKQRAILHLDNPGWRRWDAVATITVGNNGPYQEDIGTVTTGESAIPIPILDIAEPSKVIVAVRDEVLRRSARHSGMELAAAEEMEDLLRFVFAPRSGFRQLSAPAADRHPPRQHRAAAAVLRETDTWDEDSKFRFMIETSEPITSFLGSHSEADAAELARRIREGRIQIGGVHNTANTEQMSHELLARLFYLTDRHTRDLLGVPPSRTAQIDDVIGLTWPLATSLRRPACPTSFTATTGAAMPCARPSWSRCSTGRGLTAHRTPGAGPLAFLTAATPATTSATSAKPHVQIPSADWA